MNNIPTLLIPTKRLGCMRLALLISAAGTAACGGKAFDPPSSPPHTVDQDGFRHGVRFDIPFLCGAGSADAQLGVPCNTERPSDDNLLSCDAAGCHGAYDFVDSGPGAMRVVRGSRGPSCYSCHGEKWRDVSLESARAEDEDEDD